MGKKGKIKPVKWLSLRTTAAHVVHHNRVECTEKGGL